MYPCLSLLPRAGHAAASRRDARVRVPPGLERRPFDRGGRADSRGPARGRDHQADGLSGDAGAGQKEIEPRKIIGKIIGEIANHRRNYHGNCLR